MGVGLEGAQQQAERFLGRARGAQVAGQGQAGPPVARVLADDALAQLREALGLARAA